MKKAITTQSYKEVFIMFDEYTPLMKVGLLQRCLANGKARLDAELSLQKGCPHYQKCWPQDTLFWSLCRRIPDVLQSWCKACQLEFKNAKRKSA
ncbi:hypothetical protein [Candidatus Enterovibrio escicola]|nr:hypothetical protein [Candidatus Enterovibrio escacola]